MTQKLIRIYRQLDIDAIKKHLLLYGDLSGQCAACGQLGVKLDVPTCPSCQAEFKYLAFKNIKDHYPKILKLLSERSALTLVDHDDFKRLSGALKAEEFLK